MNGDVLLIDDRHRRAAAGLLERIAADPRERLVVAVGGESGSGKSEVAHELARGLKRAGRPAKVLHLDDYYAVPPAERTAWRREHGIEAVGAGEIDWPLLAEHVEAFRSGGAATLPSVDLYTDQVDRLSTDFDAVRVLIVEGLYALETPADLRVLIDLTYRDTGRAERERGKEVQDDLRPRVLEREHRAVQALRPRADLLITPDFDLVAAR